MGDLTVGLAMSVVEGALTTAQLALEEVPNLRQRTQRHLVFITGEFQMMDSFLKVAKVERSANQVVRTWVRQISELAYDFEDCIEFFVSLDNRPAWWWRLLPSCTAPMLPLDVAAFEFQELKARVEEVALRQTRYNLIGDSSSGTMTSTKTTKKSNSTGATALDMLNGARETTTRQGFADLTNLITQKDYGHHVVTVWGTCGDLGTTSVMRKAFNDPEICQKFTCRAWVKFVPHFNPHEFIRELTTQFCANTCQELYDEAIIGFLTISEATQGDQLKDFLRHVNEVKYLIVLEGLSSLAEWDAIRMLLPDGKNGSWIIVSTQQFEVASLCMEQSYQALELKKFSDDHSVCAFTEVSEGDGDKAEEISAMDEVPDIILTPKTNATTDWTIKNPIIGRESEIRKLYQYIINAHSNSFQVISICGIAGVGKSALVKSLFCNRILTTRLFKKYGWVDVSQPFNLRELSRSLLLNFHSESLQASSEIRIKNPIQECRDLLEQHNCLVVIDDLQSKEEWDLIKAALLPRSSRSIVITISTEVSIATWCADNEELVFNVKSLQAETAVDLFHHEVMRKNPLNPLKDLKEDVKLLELIVKCGGLPHVIVEIAGVLADKTMALMETICSTSDRFMQTLETNPEYYSLRGFFGWMNSYFRACPDSLKPCIIYLSLFPLHQSIRRRRVVRRWVAEGYPKDSEDKSAEQNGEMFFMKLLGLSIIQHPLQTTLFCDTRMTLYRVNGFIHEYIISRRVEENLVFDLDSSCILTTQRTGRHLVIRENWVRDKIVFESMDFSRLRSMTVFGRWKSFFISNSMKLLRVLDLEDASGVKDDDLKDIVKLLCLKFLSLRGCRDVHSLPSSLVGLRQLQTLDIRNTPIVSLPATITNLQKLQYIRAGTSVTGEEPSTPRISLSRIHGSRHHVVGIEVPGGIYKLTVLHTFGVVNIGELGGKSILKELEDLTQLRKLGVSGINRKNSEKFSSAISGHLHLESLSLQLDKENQSCLYGISLPLKSLQSLKLHGPLDKLPALQIDQLSKLTKLDLEMTILTEDAMKFIGGLPKLCTFRVKLLHDSRLHFCVKENGLELPTYRKIKTLEIACSSSLDVTFGSETMRSLELLKVHCFNGYSVKFYGLRNLCELKVLLLQGWFDDELKKDLQSQLIEHPTRPVLKLEEQPRSS